MTYLAKPKLHHPSLEQNRDAQLRTLIVTEQEVNPAKLQPVLHYDGTPITARFITEAIAKHIRARKVEPIKKGQAA
jgi:2-oxoglutarate ferredoxin oxidoreductase subunit alpha